MDDEWTNKVFVSSPNYVKQTQYGQDRWTVNYSEDGGFL